MFFRKPKHKRHLTLGVIHGDRPLIEKSIDAGEKVWIGPHPKNTVVLRELDEGQKPIQLPKKFLLFKPDNDRYLLRFLPGMSGKIAVGNNSMDFQTLLERGVVESKKGAHLLSISTRTRGKILFNGIRVLFRFDDV